MAYVEPPPLPTAFDEMMKRIAENQNTEREKKMMKPDYEAIVEDLRLAFTTKSSGECGGWALATLEAIEARHRPTLEALVREFLPLTCDRGPSEAKRFADLYVQIEAMVKE